MQAEGAGPHAIVRRMTWLGCPGREGEGGGTLACVLARARADAVMQASCLWPCLLCATLPASAAHELSHECGHTRSALHARTASG